MLSMYETSLLLGVLASIACGVMGSYVVMKRLSYLTGSIAHSAFGGIGLSIFMGWNPIVGAIGFSMACALLMGSIRYHFKQSEDTLIGAIWAIGMSIGIVCIYLKQGYVSDLMGYLFGNLLLSDSTDLVLMAGLNVFLLLVLAFFYRSFLAVSLDETYAKVINLPVHRLYLGLIVLISLTTVILIRLVGIILVIALMTLPAAAAKNLVNRFRYIQVLSVTFSLISTLSGLTLSYYYDLPTGPLIIFVAAFIYILSILKIKK